MPNTPNYGLPYPAPTAAPNVPADLQALAAAVDTALKALADADVAWQARGKRKLNNKSITNSAVLQDDDELFWSLGVGVWRIEAFLHASGAAASDIQTAWTFSGTTNGTNRSCIGPGVGTTSVINGGFVRQSTHALATAVPYGVDGSVAGVIHEDLYLIVTVAGTLRLQWSQAVAGATATTLVGGSRLYVTQINPATSPLIGP